MDKYHEKELGKLHPDVKKVKLSKKGQDHFDDCITAQHE